MSRIRKLLLSKDPILLLCPVSLVQSFCPLSSFQVTKPRYSSQAQPTVLKYYNSCRARLYNRAQQNVICKYLQQCDVQQEQAQWRRTVTIHGIYASPYYIVGLYKIRGIANWVFKMPSFIELSTLLHATVHFYMPLTRFSLISLDVLIQIANKTGITKNIKKSTLQTVD
jgi:hypothetical protein